MTNYYVPDSLRKLLVPGARVRVRLSGECSTSAENVGIFDSVVIAAASPHDPEENGRVGTIFIPPKSWMDEISNTDGHDYWVRYDRPYRDPAGSGIIGVSNYTASELEPLDVPSPA